MPAHKGNQYAKGNIGGGRYSVYKEHAYANALHEAFFEGVDAKKINRIGKMVDGLDKSKIKGKIKFIDYTIYRALKSDRVLISLMKKIFPDKIAANVEPAGLAEALKGINEGRRALQPKETP
jgi:hypothetical protein